MPLKKPRRSGRRRLPPPAPHAAPRRAPSGAVGVGVALVLGLQLLLSPAARADSPAGSASVALPAAPRAEPAYKPTDELQKLQYLGRAHPDIASVALLRYADSLPVTDPRHLETLLEVGSEFVGLNKGDDVERVAARIEALSDRLPLARPAAMLLRGQWMQAHGEVSKAERQIIEASALLPANPPDYLRLRLLMSSAFVKNRGGHYDEAMLRYNQALKLADETGPVWRRIDLRALIAQVLFDAGQTDKAAEINREQMHLATEAADEYGISAAHTTRAIQLSRGPGDGDALADWRAALEHARLAGNKHQIVVGMANTADYYLVHGDFQTAYDLSQKALPLALGGQRPVGPERGPRQHGPGPDWHEAQGRGSADGARGGQHRRTRGHRHQHLRISARTGRLPRACRLPGGRDGGLSPVPPDVRRAQPAGSPARADRAAGELCQREPPARAGHAVARRQAEGRGDPATTSCSSSSGRPPASPACCCWPSWPCSRAGCACATSCCRVSNEQLRIQAEIDPLTGLSNRHHLQAVMAQRPAGGLEGTLYLLDVDHFKQINDQCGHAGGDTVLVEIARRLRDTLRDDDLIVRWGGEEFLVLVRPLPQAEAEALAQRLLCALADAPVVHDGQPVPVSASIGFGLFPMRTSTPQADCACNWERAISLVDTAMYMAKAHGRNGACSILRVDAPARPRSRRSSHSSRSRCAKAASSCASSTARPCTAP